VGLIAGHVRGIKPASALDVPQQNIIGAHSEARTEILLDIALNVFDRVCFETEKMLLYEYEGYYT